MTPRFALALLCATTCAIASPVVAQPRASTAQSEEALSFDAGVRAFREARYGDALLAFRYSYERTRDLDTLFNIGECYARLERHDEAIATFERYGSLVTRTEDRERARTRVAEIRAQRGSNATGEASASSSDERDATLVASGSPSSAERDDVSTPVLESWWFWTIVGSVVVGGTVAGIVAATSQSAEREPFAPSDVGMIVFTLEGTW